MKQLILVSLIIFIQSAYLNIVRAADSNSLPKADYHYQGQVKFEPAKGVINASWKIEVLNSNNNQMVFLVRDSLNNIKVEGPAITKQNILQKAEMPGYWAIELTLDPTSKNRTLNLSYDGVLLPVPLENKINSINADAIELTVDSFWHPIDASFSQLFTLELDIAIDNSWSGVSNGELTKTENGFHLSNSKPGIDIPVALSNHFIITEKSGFTIYDLRESTKGQDALVNTATFCKEYLDKRFGQFEKLPVSRFLITTRESSGYSRKNYIAFTDISEKKAAPLTKFVCHEMAHFWSEGGKFDTVENWLNEAFAEYIGAMAVREKYGVKDYDELLAGFEKEIENKSLSPIWQPGDTERKAYLVQYRKGPLVLAKLEKHIGAEKFQAFVAEYMVKRISTTPVLLNILQNIAGEEAKSWFVQRLAE